LYKIVFFPPSTLGFPNLNKSMPAAIGGNPQSISSPNALGMSMAASSPRGLPMERPRSANASPSPMNYSNYNMNNMSQAADNWNNSYYEKDNGFDGVGVGR